MTYTSTTSEILEQMGAAGARLDHLAAVEAGAGNISVACKKQPEGVEEIFPVVGELELPVAVPELAGWTVFVTGSGCRLREIKDRPKEIVSVVIPDATGRRAVWRRAPQATFTKPTSEFNSHLGVHADQVARRKVEHHVLVHGQPPYLTLLSHLPELSNDKAYNEAIFRWEAETIIQVPTGVKFLPFMIPGGEELGQANIAGLRKHTMTIWAKHGLMVRSDISPMDAVDKVEYLEAGATYYYRHRLLGENAGGGLTKEELRGVVTAFNIDTTLV
ncbi:rhamnulose-1-phosphate aldolase [Actinobaculum suis]|uniref:class II aldolase/adducin family protein n=1 Tax=Actinobaculum suis TaxID=1657 RepID=UPI00066FBB45|nr:class II aldolase/adducin family protein [Actinobaculum suis]KMY22593.1 rhamnulose-1-phosphate aldolase [Actinobaculum suis]